MIIGQPADTYLEDSSEMTSSGKGELQQQSVQQAVGAKKEEDRSSSHSSSSSEAYRSGLRKPTAVSRDPTPDRKASVSSSSLSSANNSASANNRPSTTADQPRKDPQDKQITPDRP